MAKKTPSAALSDVRNVVVGSKATAQSTFQPGAPASDAVPAKATLSKNLKKKIIDDSEESVDAQVPAEAQADIVLAQLTPAPAAGTAAPAAATAAEVTTVVAPTQVGSVAAVAGGFSPLTLAVAGAGLALAGGGGGGSAAAPVPTYSARPLVDVVTETGTITYAVATQNVAAGTVLRYEITGVSRSDLDGNTLTGTVTLDANGNATLSVAMRADRLTEAVAEGVTVNFYRGDVLVATASRVSVIDTSLGAIALTTNADTPGNTGTEGDDWIVGESSPLTYQSGDVIDGDSGNDVLELNLTAQGSPYVSASVTNVETLVINAFEGSYPYTTVTVSLSRFDDQLINIEINQAAAHVKLHDMQSVAAVSILDTDKSITLNYDTDKVDGDESLTVTVSEFTGVLSIEAGDGEEANVIETLVINVADLTGALSDFVLDAPSVTLLTITGGIGDDFGLVATLAPGAEINATGFDGNFNLFSLDDLDVLRTGSGNDDAVVAGMTGEDSVFNLGEGDNDLIVVGAIAGSIVTGSGTDDVMVGDVVAGGSINLGDGTNDLLMGDVDGSVTGGSGIDDILAGDIGAGAVITMGAGVNTLTSLVLAGTVTGLGGVDTVTAVGISGSVNLGAGDNVVTSSAAISGTVTTTDGNDTVTTAGLSAAGFLNLGAGTNTVTSSAAVSGDITTAGGTDTITVSAGGVADGSVITMGDGVNRLTVTGASIAGDVTGGSGADTVTAAGLAATGSLSLADGSDSVTITGLVADDSLIAMGDGANSLTVTGATVAGDVTGGSGVDTVSIAGLAATGSLTLGAGNNVITSSSNVSGDITVGDGSDSVTITGDVDDSSLFTLGNGNNTLTVSGGLDGDVTAGIGADTVSVSSVDSSSVIDLGNGNDSLTTVGDFDGNATFGSGDDTLTVGDDIRGGGVLRTIAMGAGANTVDVTGDVSGNVEISFGDDDNNVMTVGGDIVYAPDTVTFGSGNNNSLEVGDDVLDSTLIMGSGDDNSIDIGGYVNDSTITMGSGEDISLTVDSGVFGSTVTQGDGDRASIDIGSYISGTTITQGDGDDISLTIGEGAYASTITQGDGDGSIVFGQMADTSSTLASHNGINGGTATVVNLGGGNDSVTINGTDAGSTTQIASGATLDGGDGDEDTLTINGMDDIDVIARTNAQQAMVTLEDTLVRGDVVSVTVGGDTYEEEVEYTEVQVVALDFAGTYAEGDTVTVSVGTDTYSYTLPIGQGGPDNARTVAQGLLAAMNEDGILADYGFTLSIGISGAVLTLTGDGSDLNADNVVITCDSAEAAITDNADERDITLMDTVGQNLEEQIDEDGAGFSAEYSDGELLITADIPEVTFALDDMMASPSRGDRVTVNVGGHDYFEDVEYTEVQVVELDMAGDAYSDGDIVTITVGSVDYSYICAVGNSDADVAQGLYNVMYADGVNGFNLGLVGTVITLTGYGYFDVNADNVVVVCADAAITNNANVRSITSLDTVGDNLEYQINEDLGGFTADYSAGELVVTADDAAADVAITAEIVRVDASTDELDVEVLQIADAGISGFETLTLVAQAIDVDGSDGAGADFSANFDLIEGVTDINLTSELDLVAADHEGVDGFDDGDDVTFNLENLRGGESITVSANEVTANGNPEGQVITVGNSVDDHEIGDKITVTIGDNVLEYIVSADDLSSDTAQLDANNIAESLEDFISAAAEEAGYTLSRSANELTLVAGQSGEWMGIDVTHTRETTPESVSQDFNDGLMFNNTDYRVGDVISLDMGDDLVVTYTIVEADLDVDCGRSAAEMVALGVAAALVAAGYDTATADRGWVTGVDFSGIDDATRAVFESIGETDISTVQYADDADDTDIDVTVRAYLSAEADSENDTLTLTVDGTGDFDLLLEGTYGTVQTSNYEAMDLHVADSYSHYIDTNGNSGDVINMTGGGEDKDIILDNVVAHTVDASTTEANLTINQVEWVGEDGYSNLISGEEDLDITTGSGDDWLATSADAALRDGSSIDLGDGQNRLSLLWDADTLYSGQALPLLMTSQIDGSDSVTFDAVTGSVGDVIDTDIANMAVIEVGTKALASLQSIDDVDMFAVELVAGDTYQFSMFGNVDDGHEIGADYTLYNPYLTLLDAEGNEIALSDNDGHYLNSIIVFTATESGTFYLKAASYNSESSGTYAIEVLDRTSEMGPVSNPLPDLTDLNVSGHLHQLDLMTDVVLAEDSETLLAMPSQVVGDVEVLTFRSIDVADRGVEYPVGYADWEDNYSSSATADLTISGTASTLEIIVTEGIGYSSGEDFGEDEEVVVLEALGVENLSLTSVSDDVNVVINGEDLQTLVIDADDDAKLTLSGVRGGVAYNADPATAEQDQLLDLTSITVSAEDDVVVNIDQIRTGATLTVIADSEFGGSGDADIDISYAELGDVSVAFGHDDDADVDIDNTVNSTLTLGSLFVSADRFSDGEGSTVDVSISYNSDSTVTTGAITAIASSDADLYINDNDGATLNLGSLYLESRGIGQATLQISDNDDANITVDGTVTVVAESDAEFFIRSNDTNGPASTIEMGDVFLTSCDSDALVGIEDNGDYATEADLIIRMGNVTLDGASDAVVSVGNDVGNDDVTVEIGDITATAGTWNVTDADAAVYVMNNSDSNISIGNINLTSYGDSSSQAVVRIDSDDNTTVTTGSIVAVAKGDGADAELHMDDNSDSDITVGGDVTLTSANDTYLHVYGNSDNTVMTIEGNVLMSGGDGSGVNIENNSDSSLTFEGDVTLYAGDDSLNDNQDNGNASFDLADNSDSNFTIAGNLSLNGVDTGLFIQDNQSSGFYAGAVTLTSTDNVVGSDGIASYNADVVLDNNDESTVEMDSLSVAAETSNALLHVSDNDYSEISITGDVLIASGTLLDDTVDGNGYANLIVEDNDSSNVALGVEYADDGVTVLVRNAVSVSGNDSAYLELGNNDDSVIDMGNITVASGNENAEVFFYSNDGNNGSDAVVISTGSIDITAFGDGNSAADAIFEVSDNSYADITVNGDINVTGPDARWDVNNGDFVNLTITGNVITTATGNHNADVHISNNDDSEISILGEEGLTISSGSDSASLNIDDNDDSLVSIASNVSLTAEDGPTSVTINNNDEGSTVYLGVGLDSNGDPVTGSDGAEFNQVTLTGDGDSTFSISDNDGGTDVYVGNLSLTSTGADVDLQIADNNADIVGSDSSNIIVGDVVISADVDVRLDIHAGGADTYITVGTIDIEAGDDVNFDASNIYGSDASVVLGDTIDITAGMSTDASSTYFDLDDVNGAKDITIDMSDSSNSSVDAEIIDSGDVETLTVSSSDAEIYIEGDSDAFRTLDIQNVDDAYVETWSADFTDGNDALNYADLVTVLIGNGDVQYNAWYGEGEGDDWSGDDGWYSLGERYDFTPVPQVQTISNFFETGNVDGENWHDVYNTLQFQQDDVSYRVQIRSERYDWDNEADNYDNVNYNLGATYWSNASGAWVNVGEAAVESALAIDDLSYSRNAISGETTFTLTGLVDGTAFAAVTGANQIVESELYSGVISSLLTVNARSDRAEDGNGNDVAEVFTFTGDDIGDIVIGGFYASTSSHDTVDGTERWTDHIDFSGLMNSDGEQLVTNLDDLTFTVDDTDGYFKDVIIDFNNADLGSIRLVGAGEYIDLTHTQEELFNRIGDSMIFV